jgi:phenylacetate-CoA oxygenase PaaJ subunit
VPDPEIPVISVVDLGIVRDVAWEGDTLVVTVTPTYSGCPATAVISMDIEAALRATRHRRRAARDAIAPPWTTDWLSDKGRARLEEYGIAPPNPLAGPSAAPAAARRISSGSASSAPPPARRNGAAATVWNPSTISSASEAWPRARFHDLTVTGIEKTIRDAVVVTLRPPEGAISHFVPAST